MHPVVSPGSDWLVKRRNIDIVLCSIWLIKVGKWKLLDDAR